MERKVWISLTLLVCFVVSMASMSPAWAQRGERVRALLGAVEMAGTFAQPGGLVTAYRVSDATKLLAALDDAIGTNTVQRFTVSWRSADVY